MKTAIFIYKTGQIAELPELLETIEGKYDVIACGADIEFLLEEKDIPYRSVRDARTVSAKDRSLISIDLVEALLQSDELSYFSHRNIHLGRLFFPAFFYYFFHFLYYLDIAISILEEPYDRVMVHAGVGGEGPALGLLAKLGIQALPDALRLVCEKRDIKLQILAASTLQGGFLEQLEQWMFSVKRATFGLLMRVLNVGVRMFVGKKKIRILASENWKNIGPLIHELPECELVLLDRAESLKIGLRGIVRNRMQFVHSDVFLTRTMSRNAHEASVAFLQKWESIKSEHAVLQRAMFCGYALKPILEEVMQEICLSSEKVMRTIEGTWAMMNVLKPDIVVVRASASQQAHFIVLCEVARLLGIPSLEIQHGMLSVAPESETKNHSAEYIAEYGPLDRKLWEDHRYAPRSTPLDIGSPRFDAYISEKNIREKNPGVCEILHIAPQMSLFGYSDSYDVLEYFKNIASATRGMLNAHVTVKLRASHADEAYYHEALRRAFGDIPYTVAIFESLIDLFSAADVVVSSYSTVLLEALLSGKPVIFDASLPIYASVARFDLKPHRDAGALVVVETGQELAVALAHLVKNPNERKELSVRAEKFMRENYLFRDGKSSERLAAAIRRLC